MSFKIMEAVRKGKVKKGGFQDGWAEAMHAHDVPDWYIDSLAKIGYLFLKAHAEFTSPRRSALPGTRFMSLWRFTPHFSLSEPRPSTQNTAVQVKMR